MPDCNDSDRSQRALPERAPTSAWCDMARAYAESSRQGASKYAIRANGLCGLPWNTRMGRICLAHRISSREKTQTRIAQATREQDWRRVKALQRFLVNSFSAKVLAVKRVSENDGKRTPGVDGEI